jgi:S-(hydroxymethyl)glutathione dehydrogenase/alcohol dehydrogenase
MLKIKAAVLYETGKPLIIEEGIEIPSLKEGQVLVKIHFSGVCRSQLMEVQGKRGIDNYLPHMLGHEGSGEVVEIGKNVKKVKPNDKVILGWIKGEGIDASSTKYRKGSTVINAGGVTTFSNYSVISENRIVKLPENIPLDVAVLFGCALPTGAGMILNEINPANDSNIGIFGLGGVGLSALMMMNLFSCKTVIAIDINDQKLKLANTFGSTHIVNPIKDNVYDAVMDITDGKGLDYAVESSGLTSSIELAFSLVKTHGGKCVFSSHPKQGEKISLDPYDLLSGKNIQGSWGGGCCPDRDTPILAKLYSEKRLPLEKLVTARYKLEDINAALSDMEQYSVYRPILEM